jgi:fructose/tagatose bisphosphate aldolase
VAMFRTIAEDAPIPVCLHLDHCEEASYCKTCADAGYTSIMIDASKQRLETNIEQARQVAEYCHGLGNITVEGELGTVCGVEDHVAVAEDQVSLCDPEQALEDVERSGVDIFAPAIESLSTIPSGNSALISRGMLISTMSFYKLPAAKSGSGAISSRRACSKIRV